MCATVDDVMHRITADAMTTHSPHPMDGPGSVPCELGTTSHDGRGVSDGNDQYRDSDQRAGAVILDLGRDVSNHEGDQRGHRAESEDESDHSAFVDTTVVQRGG